jgi:AcrR family transcriptional regulator
MRVTQEQREETQRRIVATARKLFSKKGFDATTTREVAVSSGIASGTFFNYFETKEALVLTLVGDALADACDAFLKERRPQATLEEELFAFIAAALRHLRPHRPYLGAAIENLLVAPRPSDLAAPRHSIRSRQVEAMGEIFHRHGHTRTDAVALHLCWTLYLAVLSFFVADESPGQEDTLALADRTAGVLITSVDAMTGERGDA